jgi:hypothetical protein
VTKITKDKAIRRFNQGLIYLIGAVTTDGKGIQGDEILAVASIMAYLGAYGSDQNIYGFKQAMNLAFEPLKTKIDVESTVNRAVEIAEIFRRPWTEPGEEEPTI